MFETDFLKGEVELNSSLLSSIDSNITFEEYVSKLSEKIIPIVQHIFSNCYPKQQIRIHRDRVSCACPICMDSARDNYAKRGNFILLGKHRNHYKCHNCGAFMRIDNFFKRFDTVLDLDMINYISNNINDLSASNPISYSVDFLFDTKEIETYSIKREDLKSFFGLIEVKNSTVWSYLIGRQQYDESKYLYNPEKNYLVILNLTKEGNIIGLQRRLFIKSSQNYRTYKLSKLYELMKIEKSVPEWLDDLSVLFNVFFININKEVTLFEGPMDSNLFKNSIGNAGAHKHFPLDLNLRYWFDDDDTGRKKAIDKLNSGEKVFLWTKLKNELNLPERKKWDLNDLITWIKSNGINRPNFENYFSNNPYDILDL